VYTLVPVCITLSSLPIVISTVSRQFCSSKCVGCVLGLQEDIQMALLYIAVLCNAQNENVCVLCRGRGRSQDSFRGSSHPHEGFQGSSQHPGESQEFSHPQPTPEVTLGGPEQSPLGRSPSNRTYSSANHLLNFQSYSNDYYGRGGRGNNEGRGRGGHRRPASKPMPYNRNKFLQANFRFLVSDAGNLKKHEADADLMLDWDDVVQV
jgi:hypothetical protein